MCVSVFVGWRNIQSKNGYLTLHNLIANLLKVYNYNLHLCWLKMAATDVIICFILWFIFIYDYCSFDCVLNKFGSYMRTLFICRSLCKGLCNSRLLFYICTMYITIRILYQLTLCITRVRTRNLYLDIW